MFAAVGVEGEHRPQQRLIVRDRHAGTLDTDRRARPAADVSSVRTYPAMATAVFVPAPRVPAAQPRGVSHAALMRETRSIDRASLVIGAGASVARSAPPTRAELARSNIVSAKLGGHWTPSLRRGALRPGSAWRRLGEIPINPGKVTPPGLADTVADTVCIRARSPSFVTIRTTVSPNSDKA